MKTFQVLNLDVTGRRAVPSGHHFFFFFKDPVNFESACYFFLVLDIIWLLKKKLPSK